ncbi:MAG: hypothetical protein ACYTFA_11405 [Planctomycetota bacterium]|jgi:hypothetical protein
MKDDDVLGCSKCGASVYKEHIDQGLARYEGTQLLCPHCVVEVEKSGGGGGGGGAFAPIEFDDVDEKEESTIDMSESRVQTLSATGLGEAGGWDESRFQRPLDPKGSTATRCRTFHCKITEGAVTYFNNQINEWLDSHPDITVKFVNSNVGPFEGKHTEPNLILTVFY